MPAPKTSRSIRPLTRPARATGLSDAATVTKTRQMRMSERVLTARAVEKLVGSPIDMKRFEGQVIPASGKASFRYYPADRAQGLHGTLRISPGGDAATLVDVWRAGSRGEQLYSAKAPGAPAVLSSFTPAELAPVPKRPPSAKKQAPPAATVAKPATASPSALAATAPSSPPDPLLPSPNGNKYGANGAGHAQMLQADPSGSRWGYVNPTPIISQTNPWSNNRRP